MGRFRVKSLGFRVLHRDCSIRPIARPSLPQRKSPSYSSTPPPRPPSYAPLHPYPLPPPFPSSPLLYLPPMHHSQHQTRRSPITSLFHAEQLWARGFSGERVRMAVFDTGVRADHPHFRNIKVTGRIPSR